MFNIEIRISFFRFREPLLHYMVCEVQYAVVTVYTHNHPINFISFIYKKHITKNLHIFRNTCMELL